MKLQEEMEPAMETTRTPGDILTEIFENNSVSDGRETFAVHSHIARSDGEFIQDVVSSTGAQHSLEIGMAYGVSTLFICQALQQQTAEPHHVVIDPFQRSTWKSVGLRNAAIAGCDRLIEFIEERSELALPALLKEERRFDFVFIDGLHTFDQALMEFYFINRMLRIGGAVVFDDANWPAIRSVTRYIATNYPAYRVIPRTPQSPTSLGKMRDTVTNLPGMRRVIHPEVKQTSWRMGLGSRCAAFTKVAEDERPEKHFAEF